MATLNAVTLRTGSAVDLPAVDRVMRAAFDPRYGEAWSHSQCAGILATPNVWLTLAEHNDRVTGFALARMIASDEAELLLIAVDPARRRRGVGGALLRAALADARGRGATTMFLEMRDDNPVAHLYRAERFAPAGRRPDYYRGTDGRARDAVTWRRDL